METELVSNLIEILQKEYEYYQNLKELADKKNEAIVENDVDQLSELLEEDKEVIEILDQLEEKRDEKLREIRDNLGFEEGQLEYEVLASHLNESWKEKLDEVREKLLEVMEELHQVNEQNKLLLQEALKLNKFSFKMISDIVEPNTKTYKNNQNNKKGTSDSMINRILDRRA